MPPSSEPPLVQVTPLTPEQREICIEQACHICSLPAPTGAEARRAEWVLGELRAAGWEAERSPAGNVLARSGPGPAVAVAAHLDTVFAGLEDIAPRRQGNLIHAPGIVDNSLGLAALLHLARRLAAQPAEGAPVLLAGTVGEEGAGDLRGARELVEREDIIELVALEGAEIGELVLGGPGSIRWQLQVEGPGGHSWRDAGSSSAVHQLIQVLQGFLELPGAHLRNVGVVGGGSAVNALAAHAHAELEIRSLQQKELERAAQATRELVARHQQAQPELVLELYPSGQRPAGSLAPEHPLVRTATAVREALGLPAQLRTASTDANAALARGIPAITLGVASGGGQHTPDEYADITQLGSGLELLETVVRTRARALG